jgi:hypothetical protein
MQGHRDRCFIGIRGGAQVAGQESAHRLELRLEAAQRLEANARFGLEAQVQAERAAVPRSANVTLTREPAGMRARLGTLVQWITCGVKLRKCSICSWNGQS